MEGCSTSVKTEEYNLTQVTKLLDQSTAKNTLVADMNNSQAKQSDVYGTQWISV